MFRNRIIINHGSSNKNTLKSLSSLKTINNKGICNPYLFRGAPMVTTFICRTGSRTKGLWRFPEEASHADIKLADLEHPSLNKMTTFCAGRTQIYVHLSSYRALKLKFLLDVSWRRSWTIRSG